MMPVSRNDSRIDYPDVLNAFADGKKHRLADLAENMDLARWEKTVLQGIASSLYRSGRLVRLEPGVYRLARVEPPTAEVAIATESERMVDAAVAMLLALSPSERRAAVARAEREDAGDRTSIVLADPSEPQAPRRAAANDVVLKPVKVAALRPPEPKKQKLNDKVLDCYADGCPHKVNEVVNEVCGSGASRNEQRVVMSTINNLKNTGRLVMVERGLHCKPGGAAGAKPPVKPVVRERAPGTADPNDHADWPLVEAIHAGDVKAEEAMLRKHEKILHMVRRRYRSDMVHYDDLLQEARLGFLHGLRKAEKGHGSNPISYSLFWVRAFVGRYFEDHKSDVRLPNRLHHNKKPTDGLARTHSVSMEQPLTGSDGDERTYSDVLRAAPTAPDDDEVIEIARAEILRRDLVALVDKLPDREAEIIRRRFLIDEEQTLDEIGKHFGLSRERIRQIENDAIARLDMLRKQLPDARPVAAREKGLLHSTRRRGYRKTPKPPKLSDHSLGPLVLRPPERSAR